MAIVYSRRDDELSTNDALEMLNNADATRLSTVPAQKPCGGEVYIYPYGTATTKGKSYGAYRTFN